MPARRDPDVAWRLLEYVVLDRRECGLPVYPVLVLAGPAGPAPPRPVRIEFPDRCILTFDFPVIELAKLQARDYVRRRNVAALALSSRMRFRPGDQVSLVVRFAASLGVSPVTKAAANKAIEYFFAYHPLAPRQSLKVRQEMSKLKPVRVREMAVRRMNPFIFIGEMRGLKQGLQKGIRQGRQSEGTAMVLRLLRRRFGPLPGAQHRAIEHLSLRNVEALGEALLDFQCPEDLTRWLRRHAAPSRTRRTAKAPQQ